MAWQAVEKLLEQRFGKVPDLDGILFLIGLNELGQFLNQKGKKFTKEQKQDLMHIGTCTVLLADGYYAYIGRDDDHWPHFLRTEKPLPEGLAEQEQLLKTAIENYLLSS